VVLLLAAVVGAGGVPDGRSTGEQIGQCRLRDAGLAEDFARVP